MAAKNRTKMNSRFIPFVFLAFLLLPFLTSAQTAQTSCPNLSRNLSIGLEGSDITALQNFLIAQNLLPQGDNTGYFGRLTKAAAIQFQTQQGLPTTSFVGPLTRAAIAKVCGGSEIVNQNQTINQATNTNQQTEPKVAGTFSASPITGLAPLGIEFVYADQHPDIPIPSILEMGVPEYSPLIMGLRTLPPAAVAALLGGVR
jgi:peptidoglycan hydrolase-like protein with peptidoglycan-binding domain